MKYLLSALLFVPIAAYAGGTNNIGSGETTDLLAVPMGGPTAVCTTPCAAEHFDTDPFGASPRFTKLGYPATTTYICPIQWDVNTGTLERRVVNIDGQPCSTPTTTTPFALYNGAVSGDGCVMAQMVKNNDPGSAETWQFGLVLRDYGIYAYNPHPFAEKPGPTLTGYKNIMVKFSGNNGINDVPKVSMDTFGADCTGFTTPFSEGEWLGACVYGEGAATTVNVFDLGGPADPGAPATNSGGGGWGTPACTILPCVNDPTACSGGANYRGIAMGGGIVGEGALLQVDNFRVYSCQ